MNQVVQFQILQSITLIMGGFSIFLQGLLGVYYSRLARGTVDIGRRETVQEVNFRQNVERLYQVSENVNNVDSFVDKYVYKQKLMGIFLCTWERICGQVGGLTVFGIVVSIGLAFYQNCGEHILRYGILADSIMCIMWITCYICAGIGGKKREVHSNLSEYLENVLLPCMEKKEQGTELLKEYREKENEKKKKKQKQKKAPSFAKQKKVDPKKLELEKMKQELVEELALERKKREKQQKARLYQAMQAFTQEKQEEKREEKSPENSTGKKNEEILQELLNEYLGEISE